MRAEVASVLEMHLNRQRQMICPLSPGAAVGHVDLCAGGGVDQKPLTLALSRRERELTEGTER